MMKTSLVSSFVYTLDIKDISKIFVCFKIHMKVILAIENGLIKLDGITILDYLTNLECLVNIFKA